MQFVLELLCKCKPKKQKKQKQMHERSCIHCICIARWPERYEREGQIKENSEATKRTQNKEKRVNARRFCTLKLLACMRACVRAWVLLLGG